jgi:hypothetical protein
MLAVKPLLIDISATISATATIIPSIVSALFIPLFLSFENFFSAIPNQTFKSLFHFKKIFTIFKK